MMAKVCGLTCAEDVAVTLAAGADLLGFVRHPASARHCADLASAARDVGTRGVLVSVGDDLDAMIEQARAHGLGWLQPYLPAALRAEARTQANAAGLKLLLPWPDEAQPACDANLYVWETPKSTTGLHGGSGQTHALAFPPPGPFLLAGGMDAHAIPVRLAALPEHARQHCRGADAASRLESSPGRKSPALVQAFVESVHACTL